MKSASWLDWAVFCCGLIFCLPCGAADPVAVPALKARVTDLTHTLSADAVQSLEAKLALFESAKGSQFAILIVPTTQPETIEQYGIRVADAWKLGRKGSDDGILLLVAKDDRVVRIEVGYGLEGVIPDVVAKRVIEEVITPRFKSGDLAGGLDAGVDRLMALVNGEALAPPAQNNRLSQSVDGGLLFALFLPVIFVLQILRAIFGPLGAALVAAGLGFLGGWFLGGIGLGLIVAMVGFVLAFLGVGRGVGGGGWNSGGGGGFSGGGGGFGGGGASGRW